MCETAKAAEEKAKEYKEDDEQERYDSAQDACDILLDAWKEADGCSQFTDEEADADWDEENSETSPSADDGADGGADGGAEGGADGSAEGGADGSAEGGAGTSVGEDASLNCEAECIFDVACYDADPNTCNDECLQAYADEYGLCDGPEAGAYAGCVIAASATCDDAAFDTCIVDYPNAMTLCN